jgi:hypothetical protein
MGFPHLHDQLQHFIHLFSFEVFHPESFQQTFGLQPSAEKTTQPPVRKRKQPKGC